MRRVFQSLCTSSTCAAQHGQKAAGAQQHFPKYLSCTASRRVVPGEEAEERSRGLRAENKREAMAPGPWRTFAGHQPRQFFYQVSRPVSNFG